MAKMSGWAFILRTHSFESASGGHTDEDVGSVEGLLESTLLSLDGKLLLPLVHAFSTALVDDTLGVTNGDVFLGHSITSHELDDGDASGSSTVQNNFDVFNFT